MRLIIMHRNDAQTEAGILPPPELLQKMGAFIGEHASKGQFLDGAGLRASATRTRLTFRDGQCTVKNGPYQGENELPSAILKLVVTSRDQALDWGRRYGKILGDGQIEIAPLNEPWDIGLMPRPENPPLRFLLVESEAEPRSPKQKADLTRLKKEMTAAGVLAATTVLEPSAHAKRLVFTDNVLRMSDGPFAESKELLGGFSLMELPSMDAAVAMTRRYAEILGGTVAIDIRPVE